jgi:hypothetical protein
VMVVEHIHTERRLLDLPAAVPLLHLGDVHVATVRQGGPSRRSKSAAERRSCSRSDLLAPHMYDPPVSRAIKGL